MKSTHKKNGSHAGQRSRIYKPLVSIITVCRNSEKTIAKTIESVLNQTYSHLEYIIIDGDSSDRTLEIIKEYESKSKGCIRWISEKDEGLFDAMNKGIEIANGKIIGIINSDDWYETGTVASVVCEHRRNDEAIIYGLMRTIKGDKEISIHTFNHEFLGATMIPHPTCFIPRNVYKKHGLFDTSYSMGADYELMLRFYTQNVHFIKLDKVLANFMSGGITSKRQNNSIRDGLRIRYRYGFISHAELIRELIKLKAKELFSLFTLDGK